MYDLQRVCAAVPKLRIADVEFNKNEIITAINNAVKEGVGLLAFPELSLCGYTCGDLFFQTSLLDSCMKALEEIIAATKGISTVIILGGPIRLDFDLYNAAFTILDGKLLGIHLKTFLPNYNEFYEKRWFSHANNNKIKDILINEILPNCKDNYSVPVGNDFILDIKNHFTLGVEICEDAWAPICPSNFLATAGAEIIVNLSASNDTIGKREYRRKLIQNKSALLMCSYIYVSSGEDESSTDLVFSGHSMIAEAGKIIKENDEIADGNYSLITDIDLGKSRADRLKGKTFDDCQNIFGNRFQIRHIKIDTDVLKGSDGLYYNISAHPFIPKTDSKRLERCKSIFDMQVGGLLKRLSVTGYKMVIGVSGGMDSTLALLVAAQALKKANQPMNNLVGITMPAFGTTNRTYNNALELMKTLGIETKTIPIKDACIQHYKDIEHDMDVKDITYENVQARERTQVLMDYANQIGAIVVGTGDLSELALGWCTYNADQMSMYGVNASIPKTLVRWLIDSVIAYNIFPDSKETLKDIIDTPISPELLPPDENGNIAQKTEDTVGPYELHDFFLYYMMRYGYSPSKIFFFATKAFENQYSKETILKWMKMFYRRFFTQQFKRSCMPDGVKVGSVCLSPRGDWRMPSDAASNLWLKEIEQL